MHYMRITPTVPHTPKNTTKEIGAESPEDNQRSQHTLLRLLVDTEHMWVNTMPIKVTLSELTAKGSEFSEKCAFSQICTLSFFIYFLLRLFSPTRARSFYELNI